MYVKKGQENPFEMAAAGLKVAHENDTEENKDEEKREAVTLSIHKEWLSILQATQEMIPLGFYAPNFDQTVNRQSNKELDEQIKTGVEVIEKHLTEDPSYLDLVYD